MGNEQGKFCTGDLSSALDPLKPEDAHAHTLFLAERNTRRTVLAEADAALSALRLSCYNPCSYAFVKQHCIDTSEPPTMLLLIIDDVVYDATEFAPTHKAGINIIKKNVGKECGDTFRRIHGPRAREQLKTLRIGRLLGGPQTSATSSLLTASAMPAAKTAAVRKQDGFTVLEVTSLSHNTKKVVFAAPERLPIAPGGHLVVTTSDGDASRTYTPYEVSSTSFSIMVKKYPGGKVSSYIHSLRPGDFVEVSSPIEPEVPISSLTGNVVVMVAGGTGVAPLLTMARALVTDAAKKRVVFFACFRNEDDALLAHQLSTLADVYHNLEPYFVFSQADCARFEQRHAFSGRFCKDHVVQAVTAADSVISCGPPKFSDAVTAVVRDSLGVNPSKIFSL